MLNGQKHGLPLDLVCLGRPSDPKPDAFRSELVNWFADCTVTHIPIAPSRIVHDLSVRVWD